MVNIASWQDKTTATGKTYVLAVLEDGVKVFVWNTDLQAQIRSGNTQIEGNVVKNQAGYTELHKEGDEAPKKAFKSKSSEIREMSDRKHVAYTQAGLSANLGGLMHDSVSVLSQLPDFKMLPNAGKVEALIAFTESLFEGKTALEKRITGSTTQDVQDEKPL